MARPEISLDVENQIGVSIQWFPDDHSFDEIGRLQILRAADLDDVGPRHIDAATDRQGIMLRVLAGGRRIGQLNVLLL